METQTINPASNNVPAAAFTPRTEVTGCDKPFNWTVNKMRAVESLSANWKALQAKDPNVTWKTLAKDIGNIVLGILVALVLTVFTLGIGGALLIREYGKQKENEAYAICKQQDQTVVARAIQEAQVAAQAEVTELKGIMNLNTNTFNRLKNTYEDLQKQHVLLINKFDTVNVQNDELTKKFNLNQEGYDLLIGKYDSVSKDYKELQESFCKLEVNCELLNLELDNIKKNPDKALEEANAKIAHLENVLESASRTLKEKMDEFNQKIEEMQKANDQLNYAQHWYKASFMAHRAPIHTLAIKAGLIHPETPMLNFVHTTLGNILGEKYDPKLLEQREAEYLLDAILPQIEEKQYVAPQNDLPDNDNIINNNEADV